MSAPTDLDHHIIDHLSRWSRTGRDGACLDRCGKRRRSDQQPLFGINVAAAIDLGKPVMSADLLDQYRRQRRSALAAPTTTTKSP